MKIARTIPIFGAAVTKRAFPTSWPFYISTSLVSVFHFIPAFYCTQSISYITTGALLLRPIGGCVTPTTASSLHSNERPALSFQIANLVSYLDLSQAQSNLLRPSGRCLRRSINQGKSGCPSLYWSRSSPRIPPDSGTLGYKGITLF
jgi:hypothetical protein